METCIDEAMHGVRKKALDDIQDFILIELLLPLQEIGDLLE